jgi:hypothetical protein
MIFKVIAPDTLIFFYHQLESTSHIDALFGEKVVHRFNIPVDLVEHSYKIRGPFLIQHLLYREISGPGGSYQLMTVFERT